VTVSRIARWDLDKTYLRTDFATFRDLMRTAFERADEKRTNPGAASLMREMALFGHEVHILSGSPQQMRKRLEEKLRMDGIEWASFTLKPNLQNLLKLRFRALRDQLGYKLPMLLAGRARVLTGSAPYPRETLFGDDAEADAFVYSLYSDILSGRVPDSVLADVCAKGRLYESDIVRIVATARSLAKKDPETEPVTRILIHLEGQTAPGAFDVYGPKVVPFYNYLQAALVLFEDDAIPASSVLRVATELVILHRFDGDQLARSYRELARRGHLRGVGLDRLQAEAEVWKTAPTADNAPDKAVQTVLHMVKQLPPYFAVATSTWKPAEERALPDYASLVLRHNKRHRVDDD
jgi:hypothetical protein